MFPSPQIECADFCVLNKIDLLDGDKLEQLEAIVSSLNPLAKVFACERGRAPIDQVSCAAWTELIAR